MNGHMPDETTDQICAMCGACMNERCIDPRCRRLRYVECPGHANERLQRAQEHERRPVNITITDIEGDGQAVFRALVAERERGAWSR